MQKLEKLNIFLGYVELRGAESRFISSLSLLWRLSFSFHFSFFILVDEVMKIWKYYVIMFVYFFTEQGKMGKTEI